MLTDSQAALVKTMLARGEKQSDIAAHFGVNGGRIAEIATGHKFADIRPAPAAPGLEVVSRIIKPNDPIAKQIEVLTDLINRPPENSRIITISAELAEYVLDNINQNNRKRRPVNIKRYARAMEASAWVLTGQPVIFSRQGHLLDGQNRLYGCVRAGVAFKTHVVFGIDEVAFAAIDNGARRNGIDTIFVAADMQRPGIAAGALRWLMIYKDDPTNRSLSFENQALLDFYKTEVDIDVLDEVTAAASRVKVIPHATLAAHLYMFRKKRPGKAEGFTKDLVAGKGVGRRLLSYFQKKRSEGGGATRLHDVFINATLVNAWNAYCSGRSVTVAQLKWTSSMDYPTIN